MAGFYVTTAITPTPPSQQHIFIFHVQANLSTSFFFTS